ncbi:MAG: response regulator transcription factor [Labilithrix sp.]|nr:response regulator transcription factor [Labilithrix sp.]MCW5837496.1 response regulator transcription factor [Labilithrix sp.]
MGAHGRDLAGLRRSRRKLRPPRRRRGLGAPRSHGDPHGERAAGDVQDRVERAGRRRREPEAGDHARRAARALRLLHRAPEAARVAPALARGRAAVRDDAGRVRDVQARTSQAGRALAGRQDQEARRDRPDLPDGVRPRRRLLPRGPLRSLGGGVHDVHRAEPGRAVRPPREEPPEGCALRRRALRAVVVTALLVDDDRDLARLLGEYLGPHDVTIVHVEDGQAGLDALGGATAFDVVLLDVMLPGMDGFEVCRRIRASHEVPIVMLTARGDDADRIVGLELGADDYVPKPFNPRELLARVRAVLRRAKPASVARLEAGRIAVGPIEIDVGARTVSRAGEPVALTAYEFRILVELAKRAGDTVTREDLATLVREQSKPRVASGPKAAEPNAYDPSVDRSLDVHVSRLRQKLEDDPKEPRFIKTVRGVGYVLARPS